MTDLTPAISFTNVTKDFGPTTRGLDDITVDIFPGEVTVLLGLSGSGKSTFLRHVNGLHSPTCGHVDVLGQRVDSLTSRQLRHLRQRIGFIFQHFHLVGPMSVLENVCCGALSTLRGPRISLMMYPRRIREKALAQLDRVGLADQAHQRADTLSGGQQQRVAIARTLLQEPEILLADEPVASLDPVSSAQVIQLLKAIAEEDNLTVLCSLHQVQLAMDFSDRIIGLQSGSVVLDSPTQSMTTDDAHTIYATVSNAALSTCSTTANESESNEFEVIDLDEDIDHGEDPDDTEWTAVNETKV